jgi:hypothetical protein
MKKVLLAVGFFSVASFVIGQKTKINVNPRVTSVEKKIKPGSFQKALLGNIVCETQYNAGSTMTLQFTLNLNNQDFEYGDSLAITFPPGITPIGTANQPNFAPVTDGDPAQTPEVYNGIFGQTITWGDNDDNYGGIEAPATHSFSIEVTIDPTVSGTKSAFFHLSGDGFGDSPNDLDGEIFIYEEGTPLPNIEVLAVRPLNNLQLDRTCSYAQDTVVAIIKNVGNTTESNVLVNFNVNGGTSSQAVAVLLGATPNPTIAPGDTAYAFFIPAFDFSGSGIKNLKAWVALPNDISTSNDTITESFVNTTPLSLSSTAYSNGIETEFDFESLSSTWNGLGLGFGISNTTVNSGTQALFYSISTAIGAPAGNYETYLVMPCLDVVQGETYRISYYRKANSSANITINGSTAIYVGNDDDIASLTTVVKNHSAITPNPQAGVWQKDSADYVATATGTVYFSIAAKGTVSATEAINVRIDDINISKVQTSSINENSINSKVYPNPTNNLLNFEVNGNISNISILTLDGKIVKTSVSPSVDVSVLSPGLYIYRLNVEGKTITGNFVKN